MKVLLVGDVNSRFVRDYASNLKPQLPPGSSIDIFASIRPYSKDHSAIFNQEFSYPYISIYKHIKWLHVLWRFVSLFSYLVFRGKEYDIIHLHYVMVDYGLLSPLLRILKGKLIITVFGSDYYKMPLARKKFLRGLYVQSDYITFSNERTLKDFQEFYHFPSAILKLCRFGLYPLEILKEMDIDSSDQSRLSLSFPKGKIIVCVGYNYNKDQQHEEIILSILNEPRLIPFLPNLLFLFPLTYGLDEIYKGHLIKRTAQLPYESRVMSHYLTEEENADLIHSCDILIQVQKNDQLSGVMQEHLFNGNLVITGGWLPYSTFKNQGIYFREVDSVAKVGSELFESIRDIEAEKQKCKINRDIIYRMSSWNFTIKNWLDLYIA
jgi:hypothetical protein